MTEYTIRESFQTRILPTVRRRVGQFLVTLSFRTRVFPMIGTLSVRTRSAFENQIRISNVWTMRLLFFDVPRNRLTRVSHLLIVIRRRTRNILLVTPRFPTPAVTWRHNVRFPWTPCVSQRFHSRGKKRSSATGDLTGTQRNPEARGS